MPWRRQLSTSPRQRRPYTRGVDTTHRYAYGLISNTKVSSAESLLQEATRRLVAEFHPDRVYLFGSHARGEAEPDSDYDFLVVVPYRVERTHPYSVRGLAALRGLPIAADVLVMDAERFEWLSQTAASLPATVKREGRVLHVAG